MKKLAKWEIRILYGFTFLCLALVAYALYGVNHQAYVGCKRVQTLQRYTTLTIQRSERTLPTLDYYRNPDHRAELKKQLADLKKTEKDFTPVNCTRKIIGG